MEQKLNNKKNKQNNTPKNKKGLDNFSIVKKIQISLIFIFVFLFMFLVMYRNSQINETFSEINKIKNDITKIQKENDQLEVSIQTSLNLSNVEQSAKELLGMQKLTNEQTIHISLPKKDYIETSVEQVIVEEQSFWSILKQKIEDLF